MEGKKKAENGERGGEGTREWHDIKIDYKQLDLPGVAVEAVPGGVVGVTDLLEALGVSVFSNFDASSSSPGEVRSVAQTKITKKERKAIRSREERGARWRKGIWAIKRKELCM